MRVRSHILFRLLAPRLTGGLIVTGEGLQLIRPRQAPQDLTFQELSSVEVSRGWIWRTLTIRPRAGLAPFVLKGIRAREAQAVQAVVLQRQLNDPLNKTIVELRRLFEEDRFVTHHDWQLWEQRCRAVLTVVPDHWRKLPIDSRLRQQLDQVNSWIKHAQEVREKRNQRYLDRELQLHSSWFDQMETFPLTAAQRRAIVIDEDNNLVVAGAGTGKTSTIVGKVGYLLRKKHADTKEILLLAFARKARDEMEERLKRMCGTSLSVCTFHSLGLRIISEVEGKRPSLSSLAENQDELGRAIERYLSEILVEPSTSEAALNYFLRYRYPRKSERDFKSPHQYYQYLKGHDIRTLLNEKVKSIGEMEVADFLTLHGIKYVYEQDYEYPTATVTRRQYRPDFYLPDFKVYIEYFGIDRKGQTAPWIDSTEYKRSMDWKRETHRARETIMVEVFSYELWEGTLAHALSAGLQKHNIPLNQIDPSHIRDKFKESGEISRVAKLFCSFLNLYKSNRWTLGDLRPRAAQQVDVARATAFLDLFEAVSSRYEAELAEKGEVDFHDMIVKATSYAMAGQFLSPYRYILVDEFQDIARGRAQLLCALLDQHSDRRLFCVGDDWQSIYRFTGSDIAIMTGFQDQFGYTQRTDLDQTFRFTTELLTCSQKFILKNPSQLTKALSAPRSLGRPVLVVRYESDPEPEGSGLRRALQEISQSRAGLATSVMILVRYNFVLPTILDTLQVEFPTLDLERRSVHRAKGLEADFVVVLDVTRGRFGFPTEVSDDPVLNLVLAQAEPYPNAEERRLFYVAITRAREQAFLITESGRVSSFVEELEGIEYAGLVVSDGASTKVPCLKCQGGVMVIRRGQFGAFWGCTNYPYCDGKAPSCLVCNNGAFVRSGTLYKCSNPACTAQAEVCPSCSDGFLRLKQGPWGPFYGCSNWRREEPSCGYTRRMRR